MDRLLPSERRPWSDELATLNYASRDAFTLPPGFRWADADWQVDGHWSELAGEDGWVYSNNYWQAPSSKPKSLSSVTRRRKWVRNMTSTDNQKMADLCKKLS
jgi:hypothetical protein